MRYLKPVISGCILLFVLALPAMAQNITPKPTEHSSDFVTAPKPTGKPLHRLKVPVQEVRGAHMEIIAGTRVIFLDNNKDKYERNRSIYY
ncbi:hypothetical protein GF373_02980, partial [bacterium]|nr:hypothetical protein [bacterium]